MDIWQGIETERKLLIEILSDLPIARWDEQSLCGRWRVRDVCGHLLGSWMLGPLAHMRYVARWGFRMNRALAEDAIKRGSQPVEVLLELMRKHAESRRMPPAIKPEQMLEDIVIHGQDIRRPLGIAHTFAPEVLRVVLDTLKDQNGVMAVRKRIAGLEVVADDIGWRTGSGQRVAGPAEAVMMAMSGRSASLFELDGPGAVVLGERMHAVMDTVALDR
ncbi:MAG: maleylpyruvate isomerase family mycothiol-dependent enzyme [Actinomycetota bacterium]